MSAALKYMMIVQGEGRGHLTQAISAYQLLSCAGMQCLEVLAGKSPLRKIPDFFYSRIAAPVNTFRSPNFIRNRKNTRYLIYISIVYNFLLSPLFMASIFRISKEVKKNKPDFILNFYEPLTGLWRFFYGRKVPLFSIAHQYFYYHSTYQKRGNVIDWFFMRLLHKATSYGSDILFAIHIRPEKNEGHIYVIPPLLRESVRNSAIKNEDHLTVYFLHPGIFTKLLSGDKSTRRLHCFADGRGLDEDVKKDARVQLKKITDEGFIESLSSGAGLITTAGYESVCEAFYLGKPVLMMPAEGHFEQKLNAALFTSAGMGLSFHSLDDLNISIFATTYINNKIFVSWVDQAQSILVNSITSFFKNN